MGFSVETKKVTKKRNLVLIRTVNVEILKNSNIERICSNGHLVNTPKIWGIWVLSCFQCVIWECPILCNLQYYETMKPCVGIGNLLIRGSWKSIMMVKCRVTIYWTQSDNWLRLLAFQQYDVHLYNTHENFHKQWCFPQIIWFPVLLK